MQSHSFDSPSNKSDQTEEEAKKCDNVNTDESSEKAEEMVACLTDIPGACGVLVAAHGKRWRIEAVVCKNV